MSENRSQTAHVTIAAAARKTGLAARTVRRFIRCGLVGKPLAEADLTELRRARRLTELGVNLASVEVILRMRRQIEELQARMAAFGMSLHSSSRLPEMPEAWLLISPDEGEKGSENE
jgi:DNA-binding transcriptional MerR regulator